MSRRAKPNAAYRNRHGLVWCPFSERVENRLDDKLNLLVPQAAWVQRQTQHFLSELLADVEARMG